MTLRAITKPTGFARFKRWAKRIGIALVLLVVIVIAVGAIYEALGRRSAARDYPPVGRLVDIGGRRMHIDCRGTGSPTVLLESGLGSGGTLDWTLVHNDVARFTRTCAYDRAGIVWSDAKDQPQDAAAVARDLHATLAAAGVSGPLVLVGHSIGGPYTRVYTGMFGEQVAGLVMVDASHPDQVARFEQIVKVDMHPGQASGLMRAATALSWTGVVRFMASGNAAPKLPKAVNAQIAAFASSSVEGMRAELAGFDRTMDQARAVRSFGNRPLVVLTAMAPQAPKQLKALGLTAAQGANMKQVWKSLHADMAAMSTRGRQQIVPDAGHYIQIDRPDVVIAAVRDVVDTVRADRARQLKR